TFYPQNHWMKMRMRTTKTRIKSETENESLPSYPFSPTNPNIRPSTTPLFMGQDCTGWVGRLELPPLSIPQFRCRPLFMYFRVRTLGLVSSFGSVLLIFCWMNNFLLLGLLFLIFCLFFFFSLFLIFPNKVIAIAAVQPVSHDF
uniref:Uncharacterized protein n=1 Tax=Mastacembelus armatus TaxID=205130 RepID=A0A7N8X5T3_9TELE